MAGSNSVDMSDTAGGIEVGKIRSYRKVPCARWPVLTSDPIDLTGTLTLSSFVLTSCSRWPLKVPMMTYSEMGFDEVDLHLYHGHEG
jgi:hypothetical protein